MGKMAIEAGSTLSRPSRWSSIFKSNKTVYRGDKLGREEGIAGAGQLEETDPIQHIAGTGIAVNDVQEPEVPAVQSDRSISKQRQADDGTNGVSQGEGSRAVSLRRGSDDEIQPENRQNGKGATEDDSDDGVKVIEVDRIEFYRKDRANFWLSNSSEHPVYLDGNKYPTAEHLFQALKFLPHRPDIANKIRKISSPQDAIKEARKNMPEVKKGWIGGRGNVAAMRGVLLLKFTQHTVLGTHLIQTGSAELVEASPTDAFWGNAASSEGGFGGGRNELGKALVRTRETLRQQAGLGVGSGAKTV